MGLCESAEQRVQKKKSNEIDKQLEKDGSDFRQKLLLLGPGESGKSTCLKQMQILHHNGFSEFEIQEKKIVVYINTVQNMIILLEAMESLGVFLENNVEKNKMILQKTLSDGLSSLSGEVKNALKALWADGAVQKVFQMRNQFQFSDSAVHFFDQIDRISDPSYRPTLQDILLTRIPTTGVVRLTFAIKGIDFEVFDVGGQRSERRKWIHCFDDVNGIIFIVAISEYDQVLREDNKTNRLIEALDLYDGICNSAFFDKTSMILFLNKKDLFFEKISYVSLKNCFPSYTGGLTYTEGIEHIRKEFAKLNRQKRKVYVHETCATDTDQVQVVINSVIDTIIQENLRDTGMI